MLSPDTAPFCIPNIQTREENHFPNRCVNEILNQIVRNKAIGENSYVHNVCRNTDFKQRLNNYQRKNCQKVHNQRFKSPLSTGVILSLATKKIMNWNKTMQINAIKLLRQRFKISTVFE